MKKFKKGQSIVLILTLLFLSFPIWAAADAYEPQISPGSEWLQGPKGNTGKTGSTGAKGDKGDTGKTGPAGVKGDKGDTGPAGVKGDKGDTGPAGAKGDKGDTGSAGAKGDKGDTGSAGVKGDKGDTGPAGAKGDKGDTGPAGPQGPAGPSSISQPYANLNIEEQLVPADGAVLLEGSKTFDGISLTSADTITIDTEGIYMLTCVLNCAEGTPAESTFGISINNNPLVAPSSTANGAGQITVIRVGRYAAGSTVRIVNSTLNPVTLKQASGIKGTAGHLSLFRFADTGVS